MFELPQRHCDVNLLAQVDAFVGIRQVALWLMIFLVKLSKHY